MKRETLTLSKKSFIPTTPISLPNLRPKYNFQIVRRLFVSPCPPFVSATAFPISQCRLHENSEYPPVSDASYEMNEANGVGL
ncbi:hypothetical protein NPIL_370111 [Nephila pilipes]|uniref:Uncharacterized protein n=1 Tax=Nephila pilipes TaxID=299642 RepID=A0A8X6JXZ0_NEPPI|nr:hypothetical protein NPIL_370111 [Nephila pilipes]